MRRLVSIPFGGLFFNLFNMNNSDYILKLIKIIGESFIDENVIKTSLTVKLNKQFGYYLIIVFVY